jgi:flagellar M-ring protein FliF
MNIQARLTTILNTFNGLDNRKKIAIVLGILVTIIAAISISAVINKPTTQPLYTNLSREDINAMSRVLSENNISFTETVDGSGLSVAPEIVAQARMILAEQGLPSSQEAGYELFDRMNTIGLTSFMQDITNKRAIEGELGRTIQMISGISSARVHIVMPEKNVYRRALAGKPTASVVLKTHGRLAERSIYAIRHMVAAAVPSLEVDEVTIVDASGVLLTTAEISGSNRLVELEREFENEAMAKISSALGAHLGVENFRVTVTAKLNGDVRRMAETVYDPDSKVERSTQIVREAGSSQNKESSQPTTVEQTLPAENATAAVASGQSSLENNERREESTQYEINKKEIQVVSDGYTVEKVAVALVVNKDRIAEILGPDAAQQEIDTKLADLEAIARSALSLSDARGDSIKVSMVQFMPIIDVNAEPQSFSFGEFAARHSSAIINALGLIVASLLFAFLGIRPLLAFLNKGNAQQQDALPSFTGGADFGGLPSLGDRVPDAIGNFDSGLPAGLGADPSVGGLPGSSYSSNQGAFGAISRQEEELRDRLEEYVSEGEQRAAMAIRLWLKQGEKLAGSGA